MNSNPTNKLTPYISNKKMQKGLFYLEDKIPPLFILIQGIVLGIAKVIMAIRAGFFKLTGGIFSGVKIPWFKVIIIGLVTYILTQKDIMINFNLNAPIESVSALSTQEALNVSSNSANQNANIPVSTTALDVVAVREYIRRFDEVAKVEMEKFKIPASIKMAQAILESEAGQSQFAKQFNNHFNIRCHTDAASAYQTCKETNFGSFQKFSSAWEGWRAHSTLLSGDKFKSLFSIEMDYKKWATQLQDLGYNQDENYGQQLIAVIEQFNLTKLDE